MLNNLLLSAGAAGPVWFQRDDDAAIGEDGTCVWCRGNGAILPQCGAI